MEINYKHTIFACYLGYVIQGIINNINPILFIIYQDQLGISLEEISLFIFFNFGIQMVIDFISAGYIDLIGYRKSIIIAHVFSTIGLLGIGVFPFLFRNAFVGLLVATIFDGIGGGLLEVMVSPIVEAAPTKDKDKTMSILHSFYCWGCIGFIAISTLILNCLGIKKWFLIPIIWMVLPIMNIFLFLKVPLSMMVEKEERYSMKQLLGNKYFLIFSILMICAGASEMGMSQWASYYAEKGLHMNKTMGDLCGPCFFCFMMGTARALYGKSEKKINLYQCMKLSGILCLLGYTMAAFSIVPIMGLLGCGICGLSVGILWPGTFSLAAKHCREGGTAMFAFLALAGDIGCVSGPEIVGKISRIFPQYQLRAGLLTAILFPVILLFVLHIENERLAGN